MEIKKRHMIITALAAIVTVFILGMYTNIIDTTSLFFSSHAYARWALDDQQNTSNAFLNNNTFPSDHGLEIEDKITELSASTRKTINITAQSTSTLKPINITALSTTLKPTNNSQGHLNVSTQAKVSYDPDLVVRCKESPYTYCTTPPHTPGKNHTFRVVLLRKPPWSSKKSPDFSNCDYKCMNEGDTVDRISEKTDAVVVYGVGLNSKFKPPTRWPHQLYGVYTQESPVHTHADFLDTKTSVWNYLFNFTVTYRLDSEIFTPYGRLSFKPIPLDKRPNYYEIAKSKNKTAAWFVSNCRTPSKRDQYVKEMQKYIDVTIYGGCGKTCPRNENHRCMKDLQTNYKFYLSFENSLCTDYISEKMFKIYDQGLHVIPVVRGGADYDQHFPNFTFINAAHFKTAKDLALHLKDLASDLETYSKYLEHIDMYQFGTRQPGIANSETMACTLCKFLHTRENKTIIYDMKSWMGDGHCHQPNDIR